MPSELEQLLARNWLFAELGARAIRELAELSRRLGVGTKRVVVAKGDSDGRLYAVLRGRVKVVAPGLVNDAAFRIMGPGEVFGEIAMLDGGTRSATVTTLEPCQLAAIDRETFEHFLAKHPNVARRLLTTLARRIRSLSERIEDLSFLDIPARLAKALLALAEQHGKDTSEGRVIELRISQQDLGALANATRESVNKTLATWKASGLLEHQTTRIVLREPKVLAALASAPSR